MGIDTICITTDMCFVTQNNTVFWVLLGNGILSWEKHMFSHLKIGVFWNFGILYWLDMHSDSFHVWTCTVARQQGTAHHLPMNFSAVESFSRLMVSTETWFLHVSAEQTEAACLCLSLPFFLGLWARGWNRGKRFQLEPFSLYPHSQSTRPHWVQYWRMFVVCFPSLCHFLGYKFQVEF
jgi:hypothetical protein